MDTYKDELAPWEKRSSHYHKIQLGHDIASVKEAIQDQISEMIQSRVAATNAIIANPELKESSILEFGYGLNSVGAGMYGLKAGFEWGISDVVWQLELHGSFLSSFEEDFYKPLKPALKKLLKEARNAYVDGDVEDALEKFLELDAEICSDFTTQITIGILYFFHEINKIKAGEYFDKALNYVSTTSHYYTAYALLYKALIKRDYGHVEEAENCTRKAMKTCPNFIEAIYQNAQYNALLNKPDVVIPLLKTAIQSDIIYCLKINNEQDFDGIRADINKMFEEIREEQNGEVTKGFDALNESISSFTEGVNKIKDFGYDLPEVFSEKSLQDDSGEVGAMISKNSIFDTYIARKSLLQKETSLKKKQLALSERCEKLINELKDKIESMAKQLDEESKRSPFVNFILYFLFGQFIAVPIGVSLSFPVGIVAAEAVLLVLCMILNLGSSKDTWKEVLALEEKKEALARIVKKY
ncbi:MAG: hypothetical protein GY941_18845 [Planctomycetes bacterium]|nr:hypothetical protein [Planctomycetota bacterium]